MTDRTSGGPAVAAADARERVLTDHDLWLLNEGRHRSLHRCLGAHPIEVDGEAGTHFAVWAPNAAEVGVIGDFDGWRKPGATLTPIRDSGVHAGFVPGVGKGAVYKYHVRSRWRGHEADKADPVGFLSEEPPRTASVVWDLEYEWGDGEWMRGRAERNAREAPMSIYEVHLGSWARDAEGRPLGYREIAPRLADHVERTGFTHVELMPVQEHPFYGSWGYQATGYFAPTARYGAPQDFMAFVDHLHRRGIGVILDWAPAHFPADAHGLAFFDGTHLYEHEDPRRRVHPDWGSYSFNFGRHEVESFLVSSALFWLDAYHVDGLRVDAVASMLYLDYSRQDGEWTPNEHGGNEDLEAIGFLRRFNEAVYEHHPDVQTIAEESTAWPMVSKPLYVGGLGFGLKWDMGWMHDSLEYLAHDPVHRSYHHDKLTFRSLYAFHENFVLPLSHDEVVHGKGSLLGKMPGDEWRRFANLRLLLAHQWAQPGKKLLFMGGEFGQLREWNHDAALDWDLLGEELHEGMLRLVGRLNGLLRGEPALHRFDCDARGFEWIDADDAPHSVIAFMRRTGEPDEDVAVVLNFTPLPRPNHRVGVPSGGRWRELLNTDALEYGGSGQGNLGGVEANPVASHGRPWSLNLTLPPLGGLYLRREGGGP